MFDNNVSEILSDLKKEFPQKFLPLEKFFNKLRPYERIFIGTACGEPQYLVRKLIEYTEAHPKAFFDSEVFHVWTLGVAPYVDQKFKRNFRHNSFFIGKNTRDVINHGFADYTPLFLSEVPALFHRKMIPIDLALIQVSSPDTHGYMSLGVSVDITKAAIEHATSVIVQVNHYMPRTHGDTFIHVKDVNAIVHHDEPILEYESTVSDDIANKIGQYVARIIEDGDTIQVGYGSIPNAIMNQLSKKNHLGLHTELLTDGIVNLMREGVIDNTHKNINRGKSIATFCMGNANTYEYINDNPSIEFKPVNYTNNPLIIAKNNNMTAINSALEIDLTGQTTATSIGKLLYSSIGGQADFMRGAVLSHGGKSILTMQSTAMNDSISRIVPIMSEGAGTSLIRGDIHYVVTEHGIAYLHGKNLRERAMALISIAHPKFQTYLIEKAKELNLIYHDQAFVPGQAGYYPEYLEQYKPLKNDLEVLLRPVKINDESLLKEFFYSLSPESMHKRFISSRIDMPHQRLQDFVVINYDKEMLILAIIGNQQKEMVVGVGQYGINTDNHTAEVALVVRDQYHNYGIGQQLLEYLTYLAKKQGLLGFTAEVLVKNTTMLHLFEKMGFDIDRRKADDVYELKLFFKDKIQ